MRLLQVPYQRCFLYLRSAAPPPTHNFLTYLSRRKTAQKIRLLRTRGGGRMGGWVLAPIPPEGAVPQQLQLLWTGVAIAMPCPHPPVVTPLLSPENKGGTREKQKDATWGWLGWTPTLPKTDSFWLVELHAKARCPSGPAGGWRRQQDFTGLAEKELDCCHADFGMSEFLQNELRAGLQHCQEAASERGTPPASPLSSRGLLGAPRSLPVPGQRAASGPRRDAQRGGSTPSAGSLALLDLKLLQNCSSRVGGITWRLWKGTRQVCSELFCRWCMQHFCFATLRLPLA